MPRLRIMGSRAAAPACSPDLSDFDPSCVPDVFVPITVVDPWGYSNIIETWRTLTCVTVTFTMN